MSQSEAAATEFKLIDCNETEHAAAILEILNEAILNSTALYDYQPRTLQSMQTWFAIKREQHFPVQCTMELTYTNFTTYFQNN